MAIFHYVAKKDPQHTVEGDIEAHSEKEALEKINGLGYVPVSLTAQTAEPAPHPAAQPRSGLRLSLREVTLFSRQLASLLKAGVPILKALSIISEQSGNPNLKAIVEHIRREIEGGAVLSTVLSRYPHVFSDLYIAMVRAGEDSGQLPAVLLKIAHYRSKQEELIARLRMALVYPGLMALVGLGTVLFMLTFVLPRLTRLYQDMGQKLPLATKMVIAASSALQHSWLWIIVILAALILALQRYFATQAGRWTYSFLQLHLPVARTLVLKTELARLSRTLELLLHSGIPILRALSITLPVVSNELIRQQVSASYRDLEQGGSFGRSLKNAAVIPLFMSNLITVGEETGKLDDALDELASSYERDTDEAIRILSSLLEPVMILGMGMVVGFIVIAMLLPIFEINVMVR